VDGIGRNVGIVIFELDVYYDEVVDVIQVVSNLVGRQFSGSTVDDEISASSTSDLVGHMWRHVELPIVPAKLELVSLAGVQ
jgi:hypothetical protein